MSFVKEVGKCVEEKYPLSRAETSWDNVGVLLEFNCSDRKALLCVDITHSVLDECLEKNIRHIFAYHPVIFTPIKKINETTPILYRCINMGVSVYTPHTALDEGKTGINAWLGELVPGSENIESIGAIQVFSNTKSIREILQGLSEQLGLGCVRYTLGAEHALESVPEVFATGCGSNGRNLKKLVEEAQKEGPESLKNKIRLVITGEASHHDLLYMSRAGVSVILLEHSRSERGFLQKIQKILEEGLEGEFLLSEADKDPIEFFTS
ncbi:hypothetical protein NECID01_1730 [Nematocida sp. AWRm77]|nr:hypothetical protein NECID01_1730 [Nematocida sp. AWRm77]